MSRRITRAAYTLGLLVSQIGAQSATATPTGSTSTAYFRRTEAQTTDTAFQRLIDRAVTAGVPGLQAYVQRSEQRWFGRAGLSSVEGKRPMALSDRIRLASIT